LLLTMRRRQPTHRARRRRSAARPHRKYVAAGL